MQQTISILLPCYNEENNIIPMIQALDKELEKVQIQFEYVFIDDGSTDKTLSILKNESSKNEKIKFIELSRNFGKDNALRAGMSCSNSDCLIIMDCDLQHPPELIVPMIDKWNEDYDVIYAYRENTNIHNSSIQNMGSKLFWKFMNYFTNLDLEQGTSDYRLLDKKVYKELNNFSENDIFFRGIVKWMGFKQYAIKYVPNQRINGDTSYSKKVLLKLAITSIISFSTRPLYFSIYLGLFVSFLTFIAYSVYLIYSIHYNLNISGWASLISTVVFFGGLNLIVLGIIGIYIGKLFIQSKGRPNYLIRNSNFKQ
jgi:glycosyltransferase involved in cell wall biosynthesis